MEMDLGMGRRSFQCVVYRFVFKSKPMGLSYGNRGSVALAGVELARETLCRTGFATRVYRVGGSRMVSCSSRLENRAAGNEYANLSIDREHCAGNSLGLGIKAIYKSEFS